MSTKRGKYDKIRQMYTMVKDDTLYEINKFLFYSEVWHILPVPIKFGSFTSFTFIFFFLSLARPNLSIDKQGEAE